jgi:hypothetical protein
MSEPTVRPHHNGGPVQVVAGVGKRYSQPDADDVAFEEPLHDFCALSTTDEFNARVSQLTSEGNLEKFLFWIFLKRYGKAATNAATSPGDSLDASGREHFVTSKAERVITMCEPIRKKKITA